MSLSSAERQAAYSARHPERVKTNWKNYAKTDKGTITLLLNYARDRAKRDGLAFDLDRDFIAEKWKGRVCELTGLPLNREAPGNYRTHPFAPSLDRKIPSLGYVKSNVRLVCFAANRAMSDWGEDVLLEISRALVAKRAQH